MSTPHDAHPELDALSAFLDGEAPEWATHVAGCGRCQAQLAGLREVAAAVGRPVPPVRPEAVDRAVARALAAAGSEPAEPTGPAPVPGPSGPLSGRPGPSGPLSGRPRRALVGVASGSIAAVLLVVLAAFAVLGDGGDRQVDTALAPAPEAMPAQAPEAGPAPGPEASPDRAGGGSLSRPVSGGDLGEVGDAGALAARLRGVVPGTGGAPGAMAASPRAAEADPPSATTAAPARCEAEARATDPGLGPLVYVAEGRRAGRPVTVLGFGPAPVTLLVLTADGCGLVFSTEMP